LIGAEYRRRQRDDADQFGIVPGTFATIDEEPAKQGKTKHPPQDTVNGSDVGCEHVILLCFGAEDSAPKVNLAYSADVRFDLAQAA
jgi:hypothetical protein